MLGWLKALSLVRKTLVVGIVSIFALGAIGAAAGPPKTTPPPKTPQVHAVKSDNIQVKTETTTKAIPFQSTTQNDSSLASGTTAVAVAGVDGVETITYKVTYTNGVQTSKVQTSDVITTAPVTQVTKIGTYVAPKPNCDPNYSGGCVPNVYPSDVDCAGGSGNGPYYVAGPVYVIGSDRYGLDRDGDGVACE